MRPRKIFYTALGYAMFKIGKLVGKRRVRAVVQSLRNEGSKRQSTRSA